MPVTEESPGLSMLPWLGGKQQLAPRLLKLIPAHVMYVEVFGGAAALLLNKPPSIIDVYNDLDGELVNLFEVIRDDVDTFLKKAEYLLYSRELYERWKNDLKSGVVCDDKVERALRFWYLMRSSFAAHPYKGWAFCRNDQRNRPDSNLNALDKMKAIHERLKGVEIDHLDFRRLIKNRDAPDTFMFLDPPYLDAEEYRLGIFTLHDHVELADMLRHATSKWLLTIGDHPKIRELYASFRVEEVTSALCVSKIIDEERPTFKQLIITNYDPAKMQAFAAAKQMTLMDLSAE